MKKYPSNLSDKQWKLIEDELPRSPGKRGFPQKHSRRDLMNAIFYLNKTGCQWRYLPKDFPPWKAVYSYFMRLSSKNIFEKLNAKFSITLRVAAGRNPNPSLVCIDSQSVDGDVVLEEKGIDGNKKIKGRKRHIVTDVMGLIILCMLTPANEADIHQGQRFINQLQSFLGIEKALVDSAYLGIAGENGKITVEVSGKISNQKGFVPIAKRWVVERTFSWLKRQKRLARDYEVDPHHGRSMVFIGMFKIILNRLA